MSEIRVTSVLGENGSDPVGLSTGFTVGPTSGTTATITHEGQASFTGICTATAFAPTAGQLSHRNLIINGDLRIAQRATSTTSNGYAFVDRFQTNVSTLNTGGNVTRSQQSLSSSDTGPWQAGLRKYVRMATVAAGTAAATSAIDFYTHIEATDMANSGWDYNSASGEITLSFWFRCSANQTFYTYLRSRDGTQQGYVFAFTASGNNTWTKITHTIPGNSNITFSDNNGTGLSIYWIAYYGTDYTNNKTLNTWAEHSGSNTSPDMQSTWLTSGAATWDITGIQLEVGPVATPFEHRSFGEELLKCYRYYYKLGKLDYISQHMSAGEQYAIGMSDNDNTNIYAMINFPVNMRTPPTAIDQTGSAGDYRVRRDTTQTCSSAPTFVDAAHHYCRVNFIKSGHGWGTGQMLWCQSGGSSSYLGFSAEL